MKTAEEWAVALKEHCGFGDFGCKGCIDIIRAIQKEAASVPSVPDGWKLVPNEPTKSMIMDACAQTDLITVKSAKLVYRAAQVLNT